jgi:hypothetical protein
MTDEFEVDFNEASDNEQITQISTLNQNLAHTEIPNINTESGLVNAVPVKNDTNTNNSENYFTVLFNNQNYSYIKESLLKKNLILDLDKIEYDKENFDKILLTAKNVYFLFYNTEKKLLRALMKKYKAKLLPETSSNPSYLNLKLDTRCKQEISLDELIKDYSIEEEKIKNCLNLTESTEKAIMVTKIYKTTLVQNKFKCYL